MLKIFGQFLYLLFFSLAVGVLFGLGISYFLKKNESFTRFPIKQTSLILLTGYSSYLLSELISLSGIISLFTCSVIMGHYCYLNISEESQRGTVVAFDTVGYLAEAFVFAYLGVCIMSIQGQWSALGMACLILLVLPIARFAAVYVLPLFYAICRSEFALKNKELQVCWYSGLIRGAIAFALCLQIDSAHSSFIKTVTLIIVLITTIFGSIFLKSFIKFIGLINQEQVSFLNTCFFSEMYTDMKEEHLEPASKYAEIGKGGQVQLANRRKTSSSSSRSMHSEVSQGKHQTQENNNGGIFNAWTKFQHDVMKPNFVKDKKETFTYGESGLVNDQL